MESDDLDCIDKIILTGEPVGDKLQLHTALSGLRPDSCMFRRMTKNYPTSYIEFRHRAGDMITL